MVFDIIRGHKLILWSERLGLNVSFVKELDKFGTHYVQSIEQEEEDIYALIVLAKLKGSNVPRPIMFRCNGIQLQSLVEKVRLGDE